MENLVKSELALMPEDVCILPTYNQVKEEVQQIKELQNDILLITNELETRYPELYKYLDETPIHYNGQKKAITVQELQDHLETLKKQLCDYFETHDLNLSFMSSKQWYY